MLGASISLLWPEARDKLDPRRDRQPHLDSTGMPAGNETYDVFVSYSRAVSTRRI
jgi:hypothetical protein